MNDIQRLKQTCYFNQFDVDQSGTVTWEDFEDGANNIAAWLEYEPDTESYQMLLQILRAYWANIAHHADDDQDGEVNLDEWLKWRESLLTYSKEKIEAETGKLVGAMFTFFDEDSDGFLTQDDYLRLASCFNNEPAIAANTFRNIDRAGNLKITKEQHKAATLAFATGDDENDKTAVDFLGPLNSVGSGRAFTVNGSNSSATLLQRKAAHFFNLLDKNGNGSLDANDLMRVAANVSAIGGIMSDSAEHQTVLEAHNAAWASVQKVCDTDQSGEVSSSEFLSWAESIASLEGDDFFAETTFLSQFLWDVLDNDKSGSVSRNEYMMMANAYRIPPRYAAKAFAHLDVDDSGSITKDEYLSAVQQFFQSDDESAVGNWLFGPL